MLNKILSIFVCLILLVGCAGNNSVDTSVKTEDINIIRNEILENTDNLDDFSKKLVTPDFLDWFCEYFSEDIITNLNNQLKVGKISNEDWHQITGNTATVLKDLYSGALDPNSPNYNSNIKLIESKNSNTTIRIVGDVSFADNWKIAPKIKERNKGIFGILSNETVDLLKSGKLNVRLICEMIKHPDFINLISL